MSIDCTPISFLHIRYQWQIANQSLCPSPLTVSSSELHSHVTYHEGRSSGSCAWGRRSASATPSEICGVVPFLSPHLPAGKTLLPVSTKQVTQGSYRLASSKRVRRAKCQPSPPRPYESMIDQYAAGFTASKYVFLNHLMKLFTVWSKWKFLPVVILPRTV